MPPSSHIDPISQDEIDRVLREREQWAQHDAPLFAPPEPPASAEAMKFVDFCGKLASRTGGSLPDRHVVIWRSDKKERAVVYYYRNCQAIFHYTDNGKGSPRRRAAVWYRQLPPRELKSLESRLQKWLDGRIGRGAERAKASA